MKNSKLALVESTHQGMVIDRFRPGLLPKEIRRLRIYSAVNLVSHAEWTSGDPIVVITGSGRCDREHD